MLAMPCAVPPPSCLAERMTGTDGATL